MESKNFGIVIRWNNVPIQSTFFNATPYFESTRNVFSFRELATEFFSDIENFIQKAEKNTKLKEHQEINYKNFHNLKTYENFCSFLNEKFIVLSFYLDGKILFDQKLSTKNLKVINYRKFFGDEFYSMLMSFSDRVEDKFKANQIYRECLINKLADYLELTQPKDATILENARKRCQSMDNSQIESFFDDKKDRAILRNEFYALSEELKKMQTR